MGDRAQKEATLASLMKDNFRELVKPANKEIMKKTLSLMKVHCLTSLFSTLTVKERERRVEAIEKKKIDFVKFQAYKELILSTPVLDKVVYIPDLLEQAPTILSELPDRYTSCAVHKIDAHVVTAEECSHCSMSYGSYVFCEKCSISLKAMRKVPNYKGLFKSSHCALRYLRNTCKNDMKVFVKKAAKKKPYIHVEQKPVVPEQPKRDFDLGARLGQTRSQERMAEFNEKKAQALLDEAKKIVEDIEKMMAKKVRPQQFDIEQIWNQIKDLVANMLKKQFVQAAILAVIGAAIAALVIWIWTSDKPTLLLKVLALLIGGLAVVGVVGVALAKFKKVINEFIEARETKKKDKKALEQEILAQKEDHELTELETAYKLYNKEMEEHFVQGNTRKNWAEIRDRESMYKLKILLRAWNKTHPNDELEPVEDINWADVERYSSHYAFTRTTTKTQRSLIDQYKKTGRDDGEVEWKEINVDIWKKTAVPVAQEEIVKPLSERAASFFEQVCANPVGPNPFEGPVGPIPFKTLDAFVPNMDQSSLTVEDVTEKPEIVIEDEPPEPPPGSEKWRRNPTGVLNEWLQKTKRRFVPTYEQMGRSHEMQFMAWVVLDDKEFEGEYRQTKKDALKSLAIRILESMPEYTPSVVPQGGESGMEIGEALESVLKSTTEAMASTHGIETAWVGSTLGYVKQTATLIRDMKVIKDVAEPFVECAIGAYYELITGQVWIPWSQRGFTDLMQPVLEKHEAFFGDEHLMAKLGANPETQAAVKTHYAEVKDLEETLNRMKVPPRYLDNMRVMRAEVARWVTEVNNSKLIASDRVEPVCVMLVGPAGTGKTTLARQIMKDVHPLVSKLHPEVTSAWSDGLVYPKTVNSTDDRDDAYRMHPYTMCDDFLQADDVSIRRQETLWIVKAVNRAPYRLNMAALDKKEGTYFTSKLVIITRNGNAKPNNLGIVDGNAFGRRIHLRYRMEKNGLLTQLDLEGKVVAVNLTRKDVDMQVAALLVHHANLRNKPDEAGVLDFDLEALADQGAKQAQAHLNLVRMAKDNSAMSPFVNAQGNSIGQSSTVEEMMEDHERLATLKKLVDKVERLHGQAMKEVKEFCEKYQVKYTSDLSELYEKIDGVQVSLRDKIAVRFSQLKDWSVKRWDTFTDVWSKWRDRFNNHLFITGFKAGVKHAFTRISEWISNTVAGKVCLALTIAATAGVIISAVVLSWKSFAGAEEVVEQSRTEKERRREEKRAEDREEAMYVKQGMIVRHFSVDQGHKANRHLREQTLDIDYPMEAVISNNTWAVLAPQDSGKVKTGNIVMLEGRLGVTVRHVAASWGPKIIITQMHKKGSDIQKITRELARPEIIYIPGKEVCFFRFDKNMPPAQTIVHHFITDAQLTDALKWGVEKVKMLYRNHTGEKFNINTEPETVATVGAMNLEGFAEIDREIFMSYPAETPDGSSGAPAYTTSTTAPFVIAAVHGGNGHHWAYDCMVTQEMIKASATPEDKPAVIAPQLNLVSRDMVPPRGQKEPIGVVAQGHSAGGKNKINPSPLAEFLMNHPDPGMRLRPATLPTVMFKTKRRNVYEKWKNAGMYNGPPPEGLDEEIDPARYKPEDDVPFHYISKEDLEQCYTAKMLPSLPNNCYFLLGPEDAVFGNVALGVAPLDLTTSAGFNWGHIPIWNRYTLFGTSKDTPGVRVPYEKWHPELRQAIEAIFAALARGEYVLGLVVEALKAENRGPVRVFDAETRRYYAGSIAPLVVDRMTLGYLSTREKGHCTDGINAVGMVPTSGMWGELIKRLARHKNLVVTDSLKFDQHNQYILSATLGIWHGEFVAECDVRGSEFKNFWFQVAGRELTKRDIVHLFEARYTAACDAVHIAGALAFRDSQCMNSGVYRTTELNGYTGELKDRLAFLRFVKDNPGAFNTLETPIAFYERNAESVHYGDDNMLSFSDILAREYKPYDYKVCSKKATGSVITNPDKSDLVEGTPFTSWQDAELIKRGIRVDNGRFYAPLQKKVIEDSLFWCGRPDRRKAIAADTVRSVLLESVLHGRAYYARMYAICERACRLAKVEFQPLSFDAVMELHHH